MIIPRPAQGTLPIQGVGFGTSKGDIKKGARTMHLTPQQINRAMQEKFETTTKWVRNPDSKTQSADALLEGYRLAWSDAMQLINNGVNNVHR